MPVEWSLTIIAISFLIMTLFAVLFFWQARRTAKAVESSLETLNSKLPEFLVKFEDILSSVMVSSQLIRSQAESLALAIARTRTLFDYVFNYEKVIWDHFSAPLVKVFSNAGAIRKGLIAFFNTLLRPGKTTIK